MCPLAGCSAPTAVPPPPGGGTRLVLNYREYANTVEPVLIRHGCDAEGDCHGGGIRGTLELSPASAVDTVYDFDQVVWQVSPVVAESSAILTRPLAYAAGGTPHPVKYFATPADSDYQAILKWIKDGVRQ
ncbi:MAG: hypothetical protein ACHQ52_04695 [Candidatus Eisenbacteria bacterium]